VARTTAEWQAINKRVIAEFRMSNGQTRRKNPVMLVTTIGRKTGRPLVTPLNFSLDGDRLVAIASAGGAERHPAWYLNLAANPEVTIERATEKFRARAYTATEPERTRLYDQQAAEMPFFGTYRRQVRTREIPVVVFERLAEGPEGGTRAVR
jgi:deazaflavin-dependent oxidoreductase (nitroreductase family)